MDKREEKTMSRNNQTTKHRDDIPENFQSLSGFWEFWDSHSTADYEDLMETVEVDVDLQLSKIYCAVEKDLITQLRTQARHQGVSVEELIDLWLREKVTEAAHDG